MVRYQRPTREGKGAERERKKARSRRTGGARRSFEAKGVWGKRRLRRLWEEEDKPSEKRVEHFRGFEPQRGRISIVIKRLINRVVHI
jgi:hypothetical protein